jgi:hypothetical protein
MHPFYSDFVSKGFVSTVLTISFPLKSFHRPVGPTRTSPLPLLNISSLNSIDPTFSALMAVPIFGAGATLSLESSCLEEYKNVGWMHRGGVTGKNAADLMTRREKSNAVETACIVAVGCWFAEVVAF